MHQSRRQRTKTVITFDHSYAGLWKVAFTALLLLGCLVGVGGCRKPPTAKPAAIRLDALLLLNPDHALLVDLDQRIITLLRQREQLLQGGGVVEMPPAQVYTPMPALAALVAPSPSPTLERHTAELRADEIAALRRVLDRDVENKYDQQKRELEQKFADELAKSYQQLEAVAAFEREQTLTQFHTPLLSARMSLAAAESWYARQPVPADERWQEAHEQSASILLAYKRALAQVDEALAAAKRDAEARSLAITQSKLIVEEARLREAAMQLFLQEEARLAGEITDEEDAVPVAEITFPGLPAGEIRLAISGLDTLARQSSSESARNRQTAIVRIDGALAALRQERQALQEQLRRDTISVAQSVAAFHGYRVTTATSAPDITTAVRKWLATYWAL